MSDTALLNVFDDLCQRLYVSEDPNVVQAAQNQAQQMQNSIAREGLTGRQALEQLATNITPTKP